MVVRRVLVGSGGAVGGVVVEPVEGGSVLEIRADRVILAAGALATSEVYLRTLAGIGQPDAALPGLMDNRRALVPFLSLRRAGAPVALDSYQFHMLALGLRGDDWRSDVHGQISTLKAASVHPIVAGLPFDTGTALAMFRRLRGGLGVANIWLSDSRREANRVRLGRDDTGQTRLVLEYGDHDHDRVAGERAVARVRHALGQLGCLAPRAMAKLLPRGSSVHYAGTLPMGGEDREHTTRADGSVRGFPGLYVVDGAGFPWLPAKNLTFTLMANAIRIASLLD
jgi:choline dehydrogenase-like flavoprotein